MKKYFFALQSLRNIQSQVSGRRRIRDRHMVRTYYGHRTLLYHLAKVVIEAEVVPWTRNSSNSTDLLKVHSDQEQPIELMNERYTLSTQTR